LLACMYDTAARLGGVPAEWLTDNMSAIAAVGGDGRRRRDPRVERFAREAGFEIVLCAPRTPETKGKVESANRFLSRLLAYEGDFDGWEGVDAAIARIERRSNEEPNGTTGVPPELLFMREKDALRPLGNRALLESMLGEVSYQTVPATMLVRCAGREFSVPRRMIGR
ncbi:DDE-type integrase/transposase/recombinase, partial [Collinsella tanakaei]|nr:DDE-type integrase/transposase/recombinase [Collinsella tanakaei]